MPNLVSTTEPRQSCKMPNFVKKTGNCSEAAGLLVSFGGKPRKRKKVFLSNSMSHWRVTKRTARIRNLGPGKPGDRKKRVEDNGVAENSLQKS